ncbi:MAG TPA: hypothetical protein VF916_04775, partial [Ktedonobacterales bacterium]
MPKGQGPYFSHGSKADVLAAVLEEYEQTGKAGWSPRHYCYRLLKKGLLVPEDFHPGITLKQSQALAFAWAEKRMVEWRESEDLPWEAVAEEDRPTAHYYGTASLRDHIASIGDDYYRAHIGRGQEVRLFVVTEKIGLYDALWRVCSPYGVDVT